MHNKKEPVKKYNILVESVHLLTLHFLLYNVLSIPTPVHEQVTKMQYPEVGEEGVEWWAAWFIGDKWQKVN